MKNVDDGKKWEDDKVDVDNHTIIIIVDSGGKVERNETKAGSESLTLSSYVSSFFFFLLYLSWRWLWNHVAKVKLSLILPYFTSRSRADHNLASIFFRMFLLFSSKVRASMMIYIRRMSALFPRFNSIFHRADLIGRV